MEKVKLTTKQANTITELRKNGFTDRKIMQNALNYSGETGQYAYYSSLSGLDAYTLAAALKFDYEVELTPEDKVKDYYDKMQYLRFDLQDHGSEIIKNVLNLLNIKIEGVNA